MDALLDALERDPTRRTRAALAVALTAVLAAGGWAWTRLDLAQRSAACRNEAAGIAEVWGAGARARIEQAFATARSGAATLERVLPRIDAYSAEWSEQRERVCVAAEVERTQDAAWRARADYCVEPRRAALATTVDVLAEADSATVLRAVTAVADLPLLATC